MLLIVPEEVYKFPDVVGEIYQPGIDWSESYNHGTRVVMQTNQYLTYKHPPHFLLMQKKGGISAGFYSNVYVVSWIGENGSVEGLKLY